MRCTWMLPLRSSASAAGPVAIAKGLILPLAGMWPLTPSSAVPVSTSPEVIVLQHVSFTCITRLQKLVHRPLSCVALTRCGRQVGGRVWCDVAGHEGTAGRRGVGGRVPWGPGGPRRLGRAVPCGAAARSTRLGAGVSRGGARPRSQLGERVQAVGGGSGALAYRLVCYVGYDETTLLAISGQHVVSWQRPRPCTILCYMFVLSYCRPRSLSAADVCF